MEEAKALPRYCPQCNPAAATQARRWGRVGEDVPAQVFGVPAQQGGRS